jgi:pimeloyl-ACP methyl ester carboxylesterase
MATNAPVRRYTVTTNDGVGLAVEDRGPEDADHVVALSHGWCLDKLSWGPLIRQAERQLGPDVRILAYDHRGHGHSDPADIDSYTVEQLGADLASVLRVAGVRQPALLVGHSMGAMAILEYLRLPIEQRPVEPVGLVLAATAAGHLAQHGVGRLLGIPFIGVLADTLGHPHRGGDRAVRALVRPMCRAMTRACGLCQTDRETVTATVAHAVYSTPLSTAAGFLPSLKRFDAYNVLESIHTPTVVISGGTDMFTPAALAHDLVAGIAGARHRHLPTAGHMLLHEAPRVVADEIARTISTHQAGSTVGRGIRTAAARLAVQS